MITSLQVAQGHLTHRGEYAQTCCLLMPYSVRGGGEKRAHRRSAVSAPARAMRSSSAV
jgi:hypothetical protein